MNFRVKSPRYPSSFLKSNSTRAEDPISNSSHSSDCSLEDLNRMDKIEEVVKAWMSRSGEDLSSSSTELNRLYKERELGTVSAMKRKRFFDITQHKISNANTAERKISKPGPQYLIKTETVGSRNCPVHRQSEKQEWNNNTVSSISRSELDYIEQAEIDRMQEQNIPLAKYSSQEILNYKFKNTSKQKNESIKMHQNKKMTPSASTSSIQMKISGEFEQFTKKQPCVGILKTPGQRKISSNHRVDFLDNLREREIPGRRA